MKSITSSRALRTLAMATALFCLIPATTQAQAVKTTKADIMPRLGTNTAPASGSSATTAREYNVAPGEETHPPVRLTPDRTEMVHLDDDAYNIIVGNPAHVNVMLSNSRTLLLAPRQPGATQFTVLNAQGKVVMQRHVIVSGPKEDYVRIRRTCLNGGANCQPTTVYYCPDICHDVRMLAGQDDNQQSGNIPTAGTESANAASNQAAPAAATGPAPNIDGVGTGDDDEPLNDVEPDDGANADTPDNTADDTANDTQE